MDMDMYQNWKSDVQNDKTTLSFEDYLKHKTISVDLSQHELEVIDTFFSTMTTEYVDEIINRVKSRIADGWYEELGCGDVRKNFVDLDKAEILKTIHSLTNKSTSNIKLLLTYKENSV